MVDGQEEVLYDASRQAKKAGMEDQPLLAPQGPQIPSQKPLPV